MKNFYQSPAGFFAVFFIAFSVLQMVWPDLMPYHHGFGFEGHDIYKPFTKDALTFLAERRLSSYAIQRILPYSLLNFTFIIFSIPFGDPQMILFFQLLQLVIALVIIWFWRRMSTHLRLGLAAQWLGYTCLLFNFATLKHDFYIPFTYDRLALASGLISLYFYFTKNKLYLLINSIISLIIWPSALHYNLLLLLLPMELIIDWRPNRLLGTLWAAGVTSALVFVFCFVAYWGMNRDTLAPVIKWLLPVSIPAAGLYIFMTQRALTSPVFPAWSELRQALGRIFNLRVGMFYAAILITCYLLLTRLAGNNLESDLSLKLYLINITYGAVQRPLQFIVAHAIYYGLPVVILVVCWKHALQIKNRLSLGLQVMFLIILLQGINAETRQLANVLPLVTIIVAILVEETKITKINVYKIVFISFIIAKGWIPFNIITRLGSGATAEFPMDSSQPNFAYYYVWPSQLFFMNLGPWIATPYLIGQTLVLAVFGYWLYRLFRQPAVVTSRQLIL